MKSDREFLKGVYEKAEMLTEERERSTHRRFAKIPRGIVAAAVALVIVIPMSFTIYKSSKPSQEPRLGASSLGGEIRSFDDSDKDPKTASLDYFTDLTNNSSTVLSARVIAVNDRISFEALEVYKGEMLSSKFTLEKQKHLGFSEGEDVLLFLNTYEGNAFRLNESYDCKYTFSEFRDGDEIYRSQDGREASIETIKSIISGGTEN